MQQVNGRQNNDLGIDLSATGNNAVSHNLQNLGHAL